MTVGPHCSVGRSKLSKVASMLKPQGQVVFVIAFLQQIAIQQASPPESARALSAPHSSIGYHYALPNPDEG